MSEPRETHKETSDPTAEQDSRKIEEERKGMRLSLVMIAIGLIVIVLKTAPDSTSLLVILGIILFFGLLFKTA